MGNCKGQGQEKEETKVFLPCWMEGRLSWLLAAESQPKCRRLWDKVVAFVNFTDSLSFQCLLLLIDWSVSHFHLQCLRQKRLMLPRRTLPRRRLQWNIRPRRTGLRPWVLTDFKPFSCLYSYWAYSCCWTIFYYFRHLRIGVVQRCPERRWVYLIASYFGSLNTF